MNATDALEFLLVGARAIQVGTANFVDPASSIKILDGLQEALEQMGIADINDVVGTIQTAAAGEDFST